MSLTELHIGDTRPAVVVRVSPIGIWVDIGAEKPALLHRELLPSRRCFSPGDRLKEVVITDLSCGNSPAERKISIKLGESTVGIAGHAKLAVGQEMTGTVREITRFGVFFDVGAIDDVLVPMRHLGEDSESLRVGSRRQVKVLTVEGHRIGGTTDLRASARKAVSEMQPGAEVEGTVTQIRDFGLFVDVGAQRDALCRTGQAQRDDKDYAVGDQVHGLRILHVDSRRGRLEVSSRRLPMDVSVGEELCGHVMSIEPVGVVFDVGLARAVTAPRLHLSKEPHEYSVGEVADVTVLRVAGERVLVSTCPDWQTMDPLTKLAVGDVVVGQITRVDARGGLFVDIGSEKEAFIPARTLKGSAVVYKKGDVIEGITILRVDPERKEVDVGLPGCAQERTHRLSDIRAGDKLSGRILRAEEFGLIVDVGAEHDAVLPAAYLKKPAASYSVGEEIHRLCVKECNVTRRRLIVG